MSEASTVTEKDVAYVSELANLAPDVLADVTDALLLVRLRWTQRADIGRDLPQHLFVVAAQDQVRQLVHLGFDARRQAIGRGSL